MTTQIVHTFFRFGVVAITLCTASWALAQDNTILTTREDGVVSTSTTEISETAPIAAPETKPWFTIEKLSGIVNQGDFVVGPGRAELELKPGQTVVYEMSVSNRISDSRLFQLEVEDIAGSIDASRAVNFLGTERGPYSIQDFISFPENTFALNLGDRARIPVTISIPADAEPGGYYGGVLVSTIQDDGVDEGIDTARSPIVARVGTLFFVTVQGAVERAGSTKELRLVGDSWWYEKGPIELAVLYENIGSVHVNPYGELRIKNIFGEEVGFVELEPWFVLPKSLRSREITWERELLFGRYTATASINRGYDDVVDEVSVVFWVLPWKVVAGIFLVVFILLFAIRAFFKTFEFKRK